MNSFLRVGSAVATAVMILAIGWSGSRAVGGIRALVSAPSAAEEVGSGFARSTVLGVDGEAAFDEIALARRAVVFVYASDCEYCSTNMWNWTDIVVDLPDGASAYAVGPDTDAAGDAYWGDLAGRVRVIHADPETIWRRLEVDSTPTTLLVENGTIVHQVQGVMSELSKRRVAAFLAHGAAPSSIM